MAGTDRANQPAREAQELENLARARFGELSEAELKLLRAAPTGEVAYCGPRQSDDDPDNDPCHADEQWVRDREIRAVLIRWLAVNHDAASHVDPKGIWVHAAKITGALDLSFVEMRFPLVLWRCRLTGDASLRSAKMPFLFLRGSWVRVISADGIDVKGSVFLRQGFTAEGEVALVSAQIDGDLACRDATLTNLVAQTAAIKGNFFWFGIRNAEGDERTVPGDSTDTVSAPHQARSGFAGHLDLTNASAGAILDDQESWPDPKQGGALLLDGFVYQRISAGPTDAPRRLQWLKRQKDFRPQPYRQLAKVLRETGDDRGARQVLYEMEWRRRAEEDLRLPSKVRHGLDYGHYPQWAFWAVLALVIILFRKIWGSVLRCTIGYGYYPQWAFWWLVGLVIVWALLFWTGYNYRAMAPTEERAYISFHKDGYPPPYYERFQPVIYSLENSFPLVKLGQTDKWSPDPADEGCPGCNGWAGRLRYCVRSWSCGLRWFRWVQICAGWVLATLFVAGVTGIVRKE